MKKQNMTNLERQYKRFDLFSKIIICLIAGITIVLCVLLLFTPSDEFLLLVAILMILNTVVIIFSAQIVINKRQLYLEKLRNERNTILRTGLFKEVYDEYMHDGFEFNLIYDKLQFVEYHNNSIDIGFEKNKHEFFILIDENDISIIADEETDCPIEMVISLSDIATIEQLYLTINDFVAEHS